MSNFPEKDNKEQETAQPTLTSEEEVSTVFSDPAEHKKNAVKKKKLLPTVIAAVLAVAVVGLALAAVFGNEFSLIHKIDKTALVAVAHEIYAPAFSAVTACGTAFIHKFFTTPSNYTVSAFS